MDDVTHPSAPDFHKYFFRYKCNFFSYIYLDIDFPRTFGIGIGRVASSCNGCGKPLATSNPGANSFGELPKPPNLT